MATACAQDREPLAHGQILANPLNIIGPGGWLIGDAITPGAKRGRRRLMGVGTNTRLYVINFGDDNFGDDTVSAIGLP